MTIKVDFPQSKLPGVEVWVGGEFAGDGRCETVFDGNSEGVVVSVISMVAEDADLFVKAKYPDIPTTTTTNKMYIMAANPFLFIHFTITF